jgi:hypothetical protein
MLNDKEMLLNTILVKVVEEISITKTMMDKAVNSYNAVGEWIGDGLDYDVIITPQGSMNLGTTNKPITDKDDYDIDLVCLLKDGQVLKAERIKNIVGNRLKEHEVYKVKILDEGEGKRCWKMQYNEFHMDILPCVPISFYKEPNVTDIRLTHKQNGFYYDKYSNPYGYRKWFEGRMETILNQEKRKYALDNRTTIEKVPTYRVKTPLQMAIQLLKRHRDICFQDNEDNAPISIIITTLAAHAYRGESNVYEAIKNILTHMTDYIEIRNGVFWISNPVMPKENFADKWQEFPERKDAFMGWIQKARRDFIDNPLNAVGLDRIGNMLGESLGKAPVNRAMANMGKEAYKSRISGKLYSNGLTGGLTTTASVGAKVVKGHTFFGK